MIQQIIKRDGRIVPFDSKKIIVAIEKAFSSVDGEVNDYAKKKARNIADYIQNLDCSKMCVEEIQDYVEKGLMATKRKDVAKAYIIYRDERTRARENKSDLMRAVGKKIAASDVQNQNANVDQRSFGGRRGEAASELLRQYALNNCMSEMSRNNHLNNEIYIHDLDSYSVGMHNCLTLPLDDLLANGFNTRQTDVRPANSVNTAFQLLAVLFQLQSLNQFGGVSVSHLDWSMIPYVRKSFAKHWCYYLNFVYKKLPEKENDLKLLPKIKEQAVGRSIDSDLYKYDLDAYDYAMDKILEETQQAVEGMYHNLNTLQSRAGDQLPFTSINYGTCTEPEGRIIIKALLDGAIKGVGALHKTPIFPCAIFQMMEGVNRHPGEPNYDLYKLAIECTSKRLYPNYANVDWSGNEGYDKNDPRTYFATMGLA